MTTTMVLLPRTTNHHQQLHAHLHPHDLMMTTMAVVATQLVASSAAPAIEAPTPTMTLLPRRCCLLVVIVENAGLDRMYRASSRCIRVLLRRMQCAWFAIHASRGTRQGKYTAVEIVSLCVHQLRLGHPAMPCALTLHSETTRQGALELVRSSH